MRSTSRNAVLGPVLALLAALLVAAGLLAPGSRAADGLGGAAEALRSGPVYVDPRASGRLSGAEAEALADTIENADKPVFVAVLPEAAEFDPDSLLRDLRTRVGVSGVYAVALGDGFDAGADNRVMSQNAMGNLTGAVEREHGTDTAALLDDFVGQAVQQANGSAPASWSDGGGDGGTNTVAGVVTLVTIGALALAGVLAAFTVSRRNRTRRAEREKAELETVRPLVDEDITAFGEELDRLDFDPSAPETDETMRRDFSHALDSYEKAKAAMARAHHPGDVRPVTEALEDGRFALATLEARRAGTPLPERRPPCFFDPRHGPSTEDVEWAPEGGTARTVPVCAADAARIADGHEPMARTVETASGRRPYWEAGPAYAPWAGGYFGGGMLPGLLVGTMLGNMMFAPHAYGAYGGGDYGAGAEGGEYTGSDFNPGDFGGGFDGGGFGGGGDFGGGGGF
ncbi:hypothetical protein LIX60_16660 [Streptomyces sp. S07_1.15]|uniref:hypothetical protein n=1 Tax=Streptomyces sp. S07_1.15 TaxID=2873925 RepID=UPI001D142915|nr:hypothetical protein [Streptomyces sp. S07_1.15]MCC3653061.1 hypothetical protein [Streptomyces sp. S07_1.15]